MFRNTIRCSTVAAALFLAGCSSIDGRYEPSCTAFEGETVELDDGQYSWDRFTDERKVDAAGQPIEPFPGFPKSGRVMRSGEQIDLVYDGGKQRRRYIVTAHAGDVYLLTPEQHAGWSANAVMPECALRRVMKTEN